MKNQSKDTTSSGLSGKEHDKTITSLPKMEMYAVLGLELSKKIFEKVEKIEESVEILARQRARDLNEDECGP